jgi:hypothetical protein
VEVWELAPGLWRWTARHPAWMPADAGEWGPEVGCVYAELEGSIVLIDPLVPAEPDERERFWRALDRDVDRLGPPSVLLTVSDHARSAPDVHARYDGTRVWVEERTAAEARVPVTDTFRAGETVAGAVTVDALRFAEVVLWLPPYRALVAGDVLLGAHGRSRPCGSEPQSRVRLCPDDWLPHDVSPGDVREALRPLLDLPVERVLLAHGEPVLEGGCAALAGALAE